MKDKVAELRHILKKQKSMEEKGQPYDKGEGFRGEGFPPEDAAPAYGGDQPLAEGVKEDQQEFDKLKTQCEELKKAAALQKDMYLRQVAETDNFKKRLQREHDEFVKFALERFLNEILPVVDGLESTLDHASPDDPIFSGVSLTLKQFVQVLEKFGVQQIAGQGEPFNPNTQEAIGMQKNEALGPGQVITVHRKGYVLNGKVIRAASVTVSE